MTTTAPTAVPTPIRPPESRAAGPTGVRHPWAVLAVLCVSLLIVNLDGTILNVALPVMVRSLQASSSELQWIVDAYAVVLAGLLLVVGSLGDRLGRKWIFLAGLAVFGAGSAAAAFAGSPGRLIATRALMGAGAAGIMPSTLSILTNTFTEPERRARAIGLWSGTAGLGIAIGPVVGGWLLSRFWWGSVFLVNVPIVAVGLVAAARVVPNSRDRSARRPDPIGAALSVAGMALLLWAIIDAPTRSWTAPTVLATLATGLTVLALFVAWERHTDHPMVELAFFRSRRFSGAMGAMAAVMLGLTGSLFLLTQYLQFALGYTALQAGVRVAPIAAVVLVAAPLSSVLTRLVGTKVVVTAGMGMIAAGLALLSRVTVNGGYLDALPAFFLLGAGAGTAFAPATDSVMGSLPLARAGVGAATNGTAIQTGGALGVGVLGSLLSTRYNDRLAPALAHHAVPPAVHQVITGSLGGALEVAHRVGGAAGAALGAAARGAFISGMDLALLAGAVLVGTAAVVVLAVLPSRPAGPSDPSG